MKHDQACNVWIGCQQCDGPDISRECTCGATGVNLDILEKHGPREVTQATHTLPLVTVH